MSASLFSRDRIKQYDNKGYTVDNDKEYTLSCLPCSNAILAHLEVFLCFMSMRSLTRRVAYVGEKKCTCGSVGRCERGWGVSVVREGVLGGVEG